MAREEASKTLGDRARVLYLQQMRDVGHDQAFDGGDAVYQRLLRLVKHREARVYVYDGERRLLDALELVGAISPRLQRRSLDHDGRRAIAPGLEKNQLYGPGDLNVTADFRDVLGEIVKNRLGNTNLAAVFPNYTSFKFRNLPTPLTAMNVLPQHREAGVPVPMAAQPR